MHRREFLGVLPASVLLARSGLIAQPPVRKQGVMLMNRIGPARSELYVAHADGSSERKLLAESSFDYHSGKRLVTDSLWEDSMPLLIPARFLPPSS